MLILTRRIGETLRIGDDVSLMVLGIQGNQVRIGADAPRDVAIHREEIYRRIQNEKAGLPVDQAPKPEKKEYRPTQHNGNSANGNYANNGNSHQNNSHTNSFSKPQIPRYNAQPQTNPSDYQSPGNTRYYSSESMGEVQAPSNKKTPNVIIKKKRVIENT